jgi:hypothetical protein
VLDFLKQSLRDFNKDECSVSAAALAYNTAFARGHTSVEQRELATDAPSA